MKKKKLVNLPTPIGKRKKDGNVCIMNDMNDVNMNKKGIKKLSKESMKMIENIKRDLNIRYYDIMDDFRDD